jgi:hypothetical protein
MMMQRINPISGIRSKAGFTSIAVGFVVQLVLATPGVVASEGDSSSNKGARASRTEFTRIRHDADHSPVSFETATVHYVQKQSDGSQIEVDLIGVVHIGEKAYYEALNDQFKQYDALLYELVAPEGTRVPRGGRQQTGADPLSGLQTGMKDVLGLEFQLDHIDYHQDNFIHADMSPEEFMESMSKNDESFAKMFFKMLGSSMAIQGSQSSMDESDLVLAMFSRDREMKMRRAMAKQLSGADLAMVAFEGKDGSTIIEHRNGKCFEILEREIKAGKQKVGVFYGAGHLPDMEKRLLEMGFSKTGQPLWYVAWPLRREAMPTVVPESVKSYPAQPQNAADPIEGSPSDARPAPAEETKTEEQDTEIDSSVPCKDCPPSRGRLFRRRSQR